MARRRTAQMTEVSPPPESVLAIWRAGVPNGYGLAFALLAAALCTQMWRWHREERLGFIAELAVEGDRIGFADEITDGKIGRFWKERESDSPVRVIFAPETLARLDELARAVPDAESDAPPTFIETRGAAVAQTGPRPEKEKPRPNTISPFLSDPTRRLDRFFEALDGRRKGKDPKKLRVLYFGTSEIGYDRVTSELRRRFQAHFGDGGKGWVPIDRTWAILDHRDVDWTVDEESFTGYSIRAESRSDGYYGLGGYMVINTKPGKVTYKTVSPEHGDNLGYDPFDAGTAWSRVEVHYKNHPKGGSFAVSIDGGEVKATVPTKGPRSDGVYAADLADGPHQLTVEPTEGEVHLYGVTLERAEGIVVDALMVIGAWGHSLAAYEPAHLDKQLDNRDPYLIVFQYGAKEVLRAPEMSAKQLKDFEIGFLKGARMALEGRDDRACLVVSPNDQAWEQQGRIVTRPALPEVVGVTGRVAAQLGCAYFNLYEAVGGSGTIREWFHRDPPWVQSDLGHLEEPGSIYVGDILADALLAEYAAWLTWKTGKEFEGISPFGDGTTVAQTEEVEIDIDLPAPSSKMVSLFRSVEPDSDVTKVEPCAKENKTTVDCRDPLSYIRTNERGQPLWAAYIDGVRGGYVGVGADEGYNFMVEARSEWGWLIDLDPTVVNLHRVIHAVVLESATPMELVGAFAPSNHDKTAAVVKKHLTALGYGDNVIERAVGTLREVGEEAFEHYRQSTSTRPLFPNWGWLASQSKYRYIRTMFQQGRIMALEVNPLGKRGMASIASAAREMGVPIRVYYPSKTEDYWKKMPSTYQKNVKALPFDDKTVILRTLNGRGWNKQQSFSKWHYVVESGRHFLAQLKRKGFKRIEDTMKKDRKVLVDGYLSVLGEVPRTEDLAIATVDRRAR